MRRFASLATLVAIVLFYASPAGANICAFGYAGMMETKISGPLLVTTSSVGSIFGTYGMTMDTVTWHFGAGTHVAGIAGTLQTEVLDRGAKAILDLTGMLFYVQPGQTTCSGYGNATVPEKQVPFADWQARLNAFIDTNAASLVPAKIRMIVVHSEANNSCVPQGTIDQVAKHIKITRGISVPLAEGLPRTYVNDQYRAKPLPANQPWWIDYILTWAYGVWNPSNPSHPRNAHVIFGHQGVFFNPSAPHDPATLWGELMGWKRSYQKIAFVLDSHCTYFLHQPLGWSQCTPGGAWELGVVANNFKTWALAQPEIDQMIAFLWPSPSTNPSTVFLGAKDLAASTRNDHQQIANQAFACEP